VRVRRKNLASGVSGRYRRAGYATVRFLKNRHNKMNSHLVAVLQALFVVFLWATSWVFIKIGLQEMPPLTFAGLRYFLAFACLLMVLLFNEAKREIRVLPKRIWVRLFILGLLFYAGTQGASFVALAYLPAVTVNLLWSFSSVTVALLGVVWLSENPTLVQWSGIVLTIIGALIYFYPAAIPKAQIVGVIAAVIGILANAVSSIMGREINRSGEFHPLVITVVSMGAGSIILLAVGLNLEGIPSITLKSWAIIIWLALVNTAFAFTLWNHTLRTLTAMESSIINGTMLIWIPIFAVIFLGESITGKEIVGLVAAGIGTIIVQLRRIPKLGPIETYR
jgi:drug/metabolite transporter (DMT)-like permease